MKKNQTKSFEESRWSGRDQKFGSRHEQALKIIKEGPVLDLGCGDGLLLKSLRSGGIRGEGIDISEVAIEKCVEHGISAKCADFSGGDLEYDDNTFEWVVMTDVLEHLYDPKAILKEAARVGRHVLVIVPNFNSLSARMQTLFGKIPENNKANKGHVYWFNKKMIEQIFYDAGLKIEEINFHTYKKGRFGGGVFNGLVKIWPSLFALNFLVIGKMRENHGSK